MAYWRILWAMLKQNPCFWTKICLLCLTVFLLSSTSSDAQEQNNQSEQQIQSNETTSINVGPQTTQPPILPERGGPPAPLNVSLPTVLTDITKKNSYAWRAKASRLAAEVLRNTPSKGTLTRFFDSTFADCLLALVNACSQLGFQIEALNSNAGELLVSVPGQSKSRLVFLVIEMPSGKTTAACAPDSDSKDAAIPAQNIMEAAAVILSKRARI